MNAFLSIPAPINLPFRKTALQLALLFLGIAAITVGALTISDAVNAWCDERKETQPLAELWQRGIRSARPLQARLSGFGYTAYPTAFARGADSDWRALNRRVAQGMSSSKPTPEQLQAEARLKLIGGDAADLRAALLRLESAAADPAAPAEVWSDLAAVRLSLADAEGVPYLYLSALDAADHALKLSPNLAEALFNRGLAAEKLGLWRAARTAWGHYLDVDNLSQWAEEVRQQHLTLVAQSIPNPTDWPQDLLRQAARGGDVTTVREIVRDFRSPSRRLLEEEILPQWGAAQLANPGSVEAVALLGEARTISAAYGDLAHDSLYREAVATIDQAADDPAELFNLATAHREFGLAVTAIDDGESIDQAKDHLDEALLRFQQNASLSPFAGRIELKLAIVEQRHNHPDQAINRLAQLREANPNSPNLIGESFRIEGVSRVRQDRLAEAQEAYAQAEPRFVEAGELDGLAGIHNLIAEFHDIAGQTSAVWQSLSPVLDRAVEIHLPRQLYQIYANAAISAANAGYPKIGLLFMEEAAPSAEATLQSRIEAHIWRADFHSRLGEIAESSTELDQAKQQISGIPDAAQSQFLEARIRAIEGALKLEQDPQGARAFFESSLEADRELDTHVWEKRTLLQLGRAAARSGDRRRAADFLVRGLKMTDRERQGLSEEQRFALLSLAGDTYETLIDLETKSGSPENALTWQEKRSARALLDRLAAGSDSETDPLSAAELRRQWPAALFLVEYAFVHHRLYAWVLASSGIHGVDLGLTEQDLTLRVQQWLSDLEREVSLPEIQQSGHDLYQSLITPLAHWLPQGADLVIVPDGPLRDLPFAALYDGSRFLIQDRALALAPSASLYLQAVRQNRAMTEPGPVNPLILGNPDLDPSQYPGLRALPSSEIEASELSNLYNVRAFLGSEATSKRFLAEASSHDLLQISSHAWLHPLAPMSSSLLFSDEALSVREISVLKLEKTRLAVLSACRTAGAPDRNGEAVESLAHAFLAAGVPGVVASLWDVEDRATADLMKRFHVELRKSGNARKALQQTQVQLIRSQDGRLNRPIVWAAFHLVGEATWSSNVVQPKGGH